MKRRIRKLLIILVGLPLSVVLLILIIGSPFHFYRGISPKAMRMFLGSNLPPGTPISKVIAFLDAHNIEHSQPSVQSHDIGAIRRNTCWAVLVECDIEITFTFDNSNRLQSTSVTEGFTGL